MCYVPDYITSVYQIQHHTTVPETVYNPRGSYKYDANGNLTGNGPRKIYWTSFNKPKRMDTTVDGTLRQITYRYGTDFQRIYKYDQRKKKATRYYGGGSVERISEGSKTHWKYYIPVGAATLEIKYRQSGSNSSPTLTQVEKQYLFKDHLGSTDVMVDDAGKVVERLSFNPWGERRESDWSEASSEITSRSTRGFTGHEMDDEIGLVNMNARIYDPVIGRFLSPDALIPNPADLQSYNRYSYVNNNPLSFTDPTGHAPVPGGGRYSYENGSFYKTKSVRYCPTSSCGKGDWAWKNVKTKVSNPGVKKHLKIRVGVYSEIVQNYGGVSRGNAKETRNNYNRLAAGELAANGKTQLHQEYLDRGYAAHVIYNQLKRYTKVVVQLAAVAITAGTASALSAGTITTTQAAVTSSAVSFAASGGVLKAALVAAATVGIGGGLHAITDANSVAGIAAHGVVGGVVSEIQGGGFAEGFVGNAVGKAITESTSGVFDAPAGTFDAGHFSVTVAGAAIAAEVAGGDGAMAALQAAVGYASNHAVQAAEPEGTFGPVDTSGCDATCTVEAVGYMAGGGAVLGAKSLGRGAGYILGPRGPLIGHPAYGGSSFRALGSGRFRFGWGRDGGPVLRLGIGNKHINVIKMKPPKQ